MKLDPQDVAQPRLVLPDSTIMAARRTLRPHTSFARTPPSDGSTSTRSASVTLPLTLALALCLSAHESVAAGAALRVRFVVGDVLMASHARGAIGTSPWDVDVMTRCTLGVPLILRFIRDAVKAR